MVLASRDLVKTNAYDALLDDRRPAPDDKAKEAETAPGGRREGGER